MTGTMENRALVGSLRATLEILERNWLRVAYILGALSSLAAIVLVLKSGVAVSFSDESDYLSLTRSIVSGHGYSLHQDTPTAFRPPGFPLFLSLTAWLRPSLLMMRLTNAALAGVVVVLGAAVAKVISGKLAAVLTSIVLTMSPLALFTATKLYPQTLATVLILCALLFSTRVQSSDSTGRYGWAAATGLSMGILTLTVPNHGVTALIIITWLIWRLKSKAATVVVVLLVALVIPVGLWATRNYLTFSEFVPVSSNGGINLLLGNSENAGIDTGVNVDISNYIEGANAQRLDEIETDHYFQAEALRWMRTNPAAATRLYFGKLLNTFTISQEMATATQGVSSFGTLLMGLTYLPVLGLFIVRQALCSRHPLARGEGLLIATYWANVVIGALAFTRLRFRVPIDPLMTIIAMSFVATILSRIFAEPEDRGDRSSSEPMGT